MRKPHYVLYNAGGFVMFPQQANEQIEKIRARREAISEHACREFSIERSAKAFLDAIRTVMEEQA